MFCQNSACGNEVASQYKFCPKCGGNDFGPQRVQVKPLPFTHATGSTKFPGGGGQVTGSNRSRSPLRKVILVGIAIAVLFLLAGLVYEYVKVAEMKAEIQRQAEVARIEGERKLKEENEARQKQADVEAQRKREEMARLELERKQNDEKVAKQKQAEIERVAEQSAQAKKQQEAESRRVARVINQLRIDPRQQSAIVLFRADSDADYWLEKVKEVMRTQDEMGIFNPYWIVQFTDQAVESTSRCGIVVGKWYSSGYPHRDRWEMNLENSLSKLHYSVLYVNGEGKLTSPDPAQANKLLQQCG